MDYEVRVPRIHKQKTRGLMGNLDGNSGNDFYRRVCDRVTKKTIDLIELSNSITEQQRSEPLHSCKLIVLQYIKNYY